MDKKILLYFFALIIFFAVVGYLFFSNSSIFKKPQKTVKVVESVPTVVVFPTPTPNVGGGKEVFPKGWLIHTSNREGYSFKYPSNWKLYPLSTDGDYKFGTTSVGTTLNENQEWDLGEVKLDISYHPQVEVNDANASDDFTQNFAVFTESYLNSSNSNDGFGTKVDCSANNLWSGGRGNSAYCEIMDTKSVYPKPYQMNYFKNEKKFYSVIVYGNPTEDQKKEIDLFINNFQLIN